MFSNIYQHFKELFSDIFNKLIEDETLNVFIEKCNKKIIEKNKENY